MKLRKIVRTTLQVSLASLAVALLFGIYIVLVGIPKTQARNLYNQGVISIQSGNIREGMQYFREATVAWPEPYILDELNRLEQLSD